MRVLMIVDHPYGLQASENVPHNRSYTAAQAVAAIRGLEANGHHVDVVDLAEDGFNPVMSPADLASWRLKTIVDPVALDYQQRLMAADYLVFAFPIWWESMPAATKGFLDKVLTKGVVYIEPDRPGLFINGIPNIKGVTLLTTMSTPAFLYRWLIGNPLLKIMFRGTFRKIGVKNLTWINAVDPAGRTLEARERDLATIERTITGRLIGRSAREMTMQCSRIARTTSMRIRRRSDTSITRGSTIRSRAHTFPHLRGSAYLCSSRRHSPRVASSSPVATRK